MDRFILNRSTSYPKASVFTQQHWIPEALGYPKHWPSPRYVGTPCAVPSAGSIR